MPNKEKIMSDLVGKYDPRKLDGFTKKNRFYVKKDQNNIYRLLPPFGSLRESQSIVKYWAVYWLKNSKGQKRAVPMIYKADQNKRVIQADPLKEKIDMLSKNLDAAKASGNTPKAVLDSLSETVRSLYVDKSYYVNVVTPTGEIGSLKLKYTAYQALKTRLRELEKDGIDPVNQGVGVYFNFKREVDDKGKTVYSVDVHRRTYKNPETGRLQTETVEAIVDENTIKRMSAEAFDLGTLYKVFTPEEQGALATLDPKVVDRLFARPDTVGEDDEQAVLEDEEVLVIGTQSTEQLQALAKTTTEASSQAATAVNTPAQGAVSPGDFDRFMNDFLSTGQISK